jgi:hypothetical protein
LALGVAFLADLRSARPEISANQRADSRHEVFRTQSNPPGQRLSLSSRVAPGGLQISNYLLINITLKISLRMASGMQTACRQHGAFKAIEKSRTDKRHVAFLSIQGLITV